MPNKDVMHYIEQSLKANASEKDIRDALFNAGWPATDVNDAFIAVKNQQTQQSPVIATPSSTQPQRSNVSTQRVVTTMKQPFTEDSQAEVMLSPDIRSPFTLEKQARRRSRLLIGMSAAVFILVIGFGVGFAYWKGIGPFGGTLLDSERVLSSVFRKMGEIQSAKYDFEIGLTSEDNSENVEAFALSAEAKSEYEPYERDKIRFEDVTTILMRLLNQSVSIGQKNNPRYRKTLAEIDLALEDPKTQQAYDYKQLKNGQDFELTVTFETEDAIRAIENLKSTKQRVRIEGQRVVFTKDSSAYYFFQGKPDQDFLSEIFSPESYEGIPHEFRVAGNVSGVVHKQASGEHADAQIRFGGEVEYGSITASVDLEFLKKEDAIFAQIHKLPGLFFLDLSGIKKQWVRFSKEDAARQGLNFDEIFNGELIESTFIENKKDGEAKKRAFEHVELFLQTAESTGLVSSSAPLKEDLDGVRTLKYELMLHPEHTNTFYKAYYEAAKNRFGDESYVAMNDQAVAYFESATYKDISAYMAKHMRINVWADAKNGYPLQIGYDFKFAPPEEAGVSDIVYHIHMMLKLSEINGDISVHAPAEFLSYEDAIIKLTGMTKEEYRFQQQLKAIERIRNGLRQYQSWSGEFPDNLNALQKRRSEIIEKKSTTTKMTWEDDYYGNTAFLQVIPNDVYTGNSFAYKKSGTGYELKYSIEMPEYKKGFAWSPRVIHLDYDYKKDASGRPIYSSSVYKYNLLAMHGVNTSNETVLSVEAATEAKIDSDKDMLSDSLEKYLGTDTKKKDSDADGLSDGEELRQRRDPLSRNALKGEKDSYYVDPLDFLDFF